MSDRERSGGPSTGHGGGRPAACGACSAPTAEHQRYCLACGALVGERRLDPLRAARASQPATEAGGPSAVHAAPATGSGVAFPAPAGRWSATRLGAAVGRRVSPVPLTVATALLVAAAGAVVAASSTPAPASAVVASAAPASTPVPMTTMATAPSASTDVSSTDSTSDTADPDPEPATVAEDATAAPDTAAAAEPPAPAAPEGSGADDVPAPTEDTPLGPDDLQVDHVWVVGLEDPEAAKTLGTLAGGGVLLSGATTATTSPTAEAMALVAGVRPGAGTCATAAAAPGAPATPGPVAEDPCALPATAPSIPSALATAGRTVREYLDVLPDGRPDGTPAPAGACDAPPDGDAAAALLAGRSPFGRLMAFRADGACASALRSLGQLAGDVADADAAPAYSYLAIGGCGAPATAAGTTATPAVPTATPAGPPTAADQLRDVLTTITTSPAYTEGGMLVVTTVAGTSPCSAAGSRATGPPTPAGPATFGATRAASPDGAASPRAAGGKATPAPSVVLTPWTPPGTTTDTAYDALSIARSTAVAIGVDPPADAAGSAVVPFGEDVLGRAAPGADAAGSAATGR